MGIRTEAKSHFQECPCQAKERKREKSKCERHYLCTFKCPKSMVKSTVKYLCCSLSLFFVVLTCLSMKKQGNWSILGCELSLTLVSFLSWSHLGLLVSSFFSYNFYHSVYSDLRVHLTGHGAASGK